ncbi:hypothetical protein EVAR_38837_1 [Eumeta japonica]|uniref:Uncharacterized protein n=1 Tax=Eumeta variegata TaxID=151549 RepID=A0A4C1XPS6_EUMVA|nr:hypothetical protein EVAR_38837_1 [Eumeta japonica]
MPWSKPWGEIHADRLGTCLPLMEKDVGKGCQRRKRLAPEASCSVPSPPASGPVPTDSCVRGTGLFIFFVRRQPDCLLAPQLRKPPPTVLTGLSQTESTDRFAGEQSPSEAHALLRRWRDTNQ